MRFCKDCGAVLDLFGDRAKELCSACTQHKKEAEIIHIPVGEEKTYDSGTLENSTLSVENGKMILRSQEGWELWSCNQDTPIALKTILTRAKRIYEIRLRRLKN